MSVRLVIDPLEFVRKAEVRHGKIAIAEFVRLQDYLHENHGDILYQVSGILDHDDKPHLHIKIEGEIQLCCQRCLGRLSRLLDIDTVLLLVQTEQELEMNDANESIDAILADVDMDVFHLIEDEIILSLSISSRHEEGSCEIHYPKQLNGTELPDVKNPFAILSALKKTQH